MAIRVNRPKRPAGNYQSALVTGATGGIGGAFARALPATTRLLLTGRSPEALAALEQALAGDGRDVEALVADLSVAEDRRRLAERADARGIDLFVNNAGTGRLGAVLDQPPEVEAETVTVNVVAVAELTRALLPGMLARAKHDGRRCGLIIVSSGTAFSPLPYLTTYAASKAFGLFYAEGLAEELAAEPADVLALCPGPTQTRFGSEAGPVSADRIPGASKPAEVARAALDALGRRRTLATGLVGRLAVEPFLPPRRMVTGGLGRAMRTIDWWSRRR